MTGFRHESVLTRLQQRYFFCPASAKHSRDIETCPGFSPGFLVVPKHQLLLEALKPRKALNLVKDIILFSSLSSSAMNFNGLLIQF